MIAGASALAGLVIIVIGIAEVIGAVVNCLKKTDGGQAESDRQFKKSRYRYYAKSHIMTARENECFKILNEIFGERWFVVPQVHLSALLNHKVEGQNWNGAFRHINGKSVDFVLVGKESYKIVCAIELDDVTHARPDRRERDEEVERIFREARIPLARISRFEGATRQEIAEVVAGAIRGVARKP